MQERFRPFEPDTDNAGVGSFFVIIGHIQILGMSFLLLKFAANRQHKLKYTHAPALLSFMAVCPFVGRMKAMKCGRYQKFQER